MKAEKTGAFCEHEPVEFRVTWALELANDAQDVFVTLQLPQNLRLLHRVVDVEVEYFVAGQFADPELTPLSPFSCEPDHAEIGFGYVSDELEMIVWRPSSRLPQGISVVLRKGCIYSYWRLAAAMP